MIYIYIEVIACGSACSLYLVEDESGVKMWAVMGCGEVLIVCDMRVA